MSSGVTTILLLVGLTSAMFLSGCAVGPNYRPPQTKVDTAFANGSQTNLSTEPAVVTWWRGFNDETLNRLVDRAVAANHDLRIATARVREARAQRTAVVLDIFPTVTASGGYTKSVSSKDANAIPLTRDQRELSLYDAGFDATWEVDIFGRVRRAIQASNAEVAALEASRRDVLVSLMAEVARNYFELRGAQHELEVARQNAENQRETLAIVTDKLPRRSRHATGRGPRPARNWTPRWPVFRPSKPSSNASSIAWGP